MCLKKMTFYNCGWQSQVAFLPKATIVIFLTEILMMNTINAVFVSVVTLLTFVNFCFLIVCVYEDLTFFKKEVYYHVVFLEVFQLRNEISYPLCEN